MNRLTLAAALLIVPGLAAAQSSQYNAPQQNQSMEIKNQPQAPKADAPAAAVKVNIPKSDCGETPVYPGGAAMRAMDDKRKKFERQLEHFKTCMMAYIEQEKQLTLGHQDAYKSAVEQYNTAMKEINAAQEAAR